ncbi:cell division protein FtsI (penicillin-binding protein 3) [Zhouia amylolytica]|uniref:Cell division protein FtsI (Penicillin-binding protein 3) n=1 Tax=Zhouia amylolytica TaxID=376730 RepID=A0A1I6RIY8_9FLAO|nr:penicillin-binding protein [Zhouia amylolytica]MCQ0110581.1 transpeptidase family protein [Zhouia amylolytica]SFS64635.1 cell division protein FtsI (penicillin-binding protein 3) [Zhouia amylolytica]
MPTTEKHILNRLYVIAGLIFVFAVAVVVKLVSIQTVDGDKYRELASERTVKNFTIEPNRGNLYSDDGSLLATSVAKYDIRFDALAPNSENFEKHIKPLSDSMSVMFGKSSSYYQNLFRKARATKNRYMLLSRNLGYTDYIRVKSFPLFNLGPYKGGIIVEQETKREYPLGKIAKRSIGYDRLSNPVGLEGAFNQYLEGKEGHRLKQKIAKGQWKPITDYNEVEPQDGYDVVSTIDVNIQDIAHHALLAQLEKYKADHGCVVVMDVESGEVKAISNLGRTENGKYYEKLNYAVGESHEPGSTFKLMSVIAALEDKVVDTNYVVDTEKGILTFYNRYKVRDSKWGGYGKISLSEAFERSSNTGIVKVIDKFYGDDPKRFVNRLYNMRLNEPLGLAIKGEGEPFIPHPNDKERWSGIALPWMAYGYGVQMTPLQILTFYNAIANNGVMVKPRLIKEVKEWNRTVMKFDKEVINSSICSQETIDKVKALLKNVVEKDHGTGHKLYSPNFSMAGKTGTAQKNYAAKDRQKLQYISSFAGFFPADSPKYSCIVVIHEPDKSVGIYGADVSGPVFKRVAQKIYTDSPVIDTVKDLEKPNPSVEEKYRAYYSKVQNHSNIIPDVEGMSGMDAVSILENLGVKVKVVGNGKVRKQSVKSGSKINKGQTIVLQLS